MARFSSLLVSFLCVLGLLSVVVLGSTEISPSVVKKDVFENSGVEISGMKSALLGKADKAVLAKLEDKIASLWEELPEDARESYLHQRNLNGVNDIIEGILGALISPVADVIGDTIIAIMENLDLTDISVELDTLMIPYLRLIVNNDIFNVFVELKTDYFEVDCNCQGTDGQDVTVELDLENAVLNVDADIAGNAIIGTAANPALIAANGAINANIDAVIEEVDVYAKISADQLPANIQIGSQSVGLTAKLDADTLPINIELEQLSLGAAPYAVTTIILIFFFTLVFTLLWQLWQLREIKAAITALGEEDGLEDDSGPFCNVCGCQSDFSKTFCTECGSKIIKYELSTN